MKNGSMTGAERQRRYRAAARMQSIDVTHETLDRLTALREQLGLSVNATLRRALKTLEASLPPSAPGRQ